MKKYIVMSLIGCLLLTTLGCIEEIFAPTTTPPAPVWKERSLVAVDETINLSAGEYWYYHVPTTSSIGIRNYRYEVVFREESESDANFYIMDSRAFEHFKEGESFYCFYSKKDTSYFSYTVDHPYDEHYVVVSNKDSIFRSKKVYLELVVKWEQKS